MASFLIPASAITILLFFLSAAPSVTAIVVDIDGDFVINGGIYYILPALIGTSSLTWTPNNSSSPCPLFIKQEGLGALGSPVRITSPVRLPFIPDGAPVTFSFDGVNTPCLEPLVWSVAAAAENNDQMYVVAGNGKLVNDLFKIEETESTIEFWKAYKIVYCYQYAKDCFDFGSLDGVLAITPNDTLPVTFVKASHSQLPSLIKQFGTM